MTIKNESINIKSTKSTIRKESNTTKKKFFTKMLLLTMLGTMNMSALAAGNIDDTHLPSQFISHSIRTETKSRAKEDATSHYIYNKSSLTLRVASRVIINGQKINKTSGGGYVLVPTGEYFIYNNVFEDNGYRSMDCQLHIYVDKKWTGGILSGLWSPDSVGSYPVARQ